MKEVTPKEKLIISEWKKRLSQYEKEKQALKDVLIKYGVASSEFNAAESSLRCLKKNLIILRKRIMIFCPIFDKS